jgi:hypothetical protein
MQRLLDQTPEHPTTTPRQRIAIVAVAVVATSVIFGMAALLGSWAYHFRLLTSHETRVARMLSQKPTVAVVTRALENEKSPLLAVPASVEELRRAAETWGATRRSEILAKGARASQTRVFRSGEVAYFLFFDDSGVLSDFTCVLE